jgi:DNA-binding NtrC family response regulator
LKKRECQKLGPMNIIAKPRILLVDDDELVLESFAGCFESMGYEPECENNPEVALELIQVNEYDLIFLDLKMEPIDGYSILHEIKKVNPLTTVIIISGFGELDEAIEAVEKGAYHIIKKPIDYKDLQFFTRKAWEFHLIKSELGKLRNEIQFNRKREDKFITQNANFIKMIELAKEIAESEIPVLIRGESGTGKELMAEFIHENSSRKGQPMIKINCAAIPENLLESELFGHVKGSFTGAIKDRKGRFEMANNGTIFLDEIGEIPLSFQVKLLRVLQSQEFESVGESKTKRVNVRIIAATNSNLEEAIKEKTFREDLYYRLNGIQLKLLSLRERVDDIQPLIEYFIDKYKNQEQGPITLSHEALRLLKAYRWSGNVRELQNVIHRAVVLAKTGLIEPRHLPPEIYSRDEKNEDLVSLEELEKTHIKKVLQRTNDYKEAAEILGIDLTTLWRKRKKYDIV